MNIHKGNPSKSHKISGERISVLLSHFGANLSGDQLAQIQTYLGLLLKWNEAIGLTTVSDPEEIISRHFGESMFLESILPVENGRLADVGSGAGFPGLAIKIIAPQLHVIFIDSNKKKCAFLNEVIRSLGFSNAEVVANRFEDIRETKNFADIITARAVGEFRMLLKWAKNSLSNQGHLALWVGMADSTAISQAPGWLWQPAINIPESHRRFLLVGSPQSSH